ncbi:MAG: AraC family transcriptional regulator [Spirochaetota bacterium]
MDWSFISGKIAPLIEESIRVPLIEPGMNANFSDGFIAKKTVPCSIIAQAYDGKFGIQLEDREMIKTEAGGAYIVGANSALTIGHYAEGSSDGIMKGRWVHIHFTVFGTLDLLSLFDMPLTVPKDTADRFGDIIQTMLDSRDTPLMPIARTAARNASAFRILEILCSLSRPSPTASVIMRHSAALAPALSFIRSELHGHIEVKDIAGSAGLSPSHLHTLFRETVGVPPMEYVKELRLTETRYRVATTDTTLAEIARSAGFADQFHFSRSFKERFGVTPSAYRKQYADTM